MGEQVCTLVLELIN